MLVINFNIKHVILTRSPATVNMFTLLLLILLLMLLLILPQKRPLPYPGGGITDKPRSRTVCSSAAEAFFDRAAHARGRRGNHKFTLGFEASSDKIFIQETAAVTPGAGGRASGGVISPQVDRFFSS